MIIGSGMIAKAMTCQEGVIFACGVSDSRCNNPREFLREKKRLQNVMKTGEPVVYFGTCSQENTPYVKHKLELEGMVLAEGGTVFRLPIVAGFSNNQNTLLNVLHRKIVSHETIQVHKNAVRRVVDVDDVAAVVKSLIRERGVFDVAPRESYTITEIIKVFEEVTGIEAKMELVNKGHDYDIAPMSFDFLPLSGVIKKYYAGCLSPR